ncbi:MAG: hypothetical protein NTNFB01_34530 [Nitrospira sp.]
MEWSYGVTCYGAIVSGSSTLVVGAVNFTMRSALVAEKARQGKLTCCLHWVDGVEMPQSYAEQCNGTGPL